MMWCLKNVEKHTEPEQFCNDLHGKAPKLLIDRKRKRNEEEWIQNKKKQHVNTGQEYTYKSSKTGQQKIRPARRVKESCKASCKRKCNSIITDDERKKIHEKFWKLGNIRSQAMFLINFVTSSAVKRRKKKVNKVTTADRNESSQKYFKRTQTRNYYLQKDDESRVQVCKTFFLATLDISEKRIRTALSKSEVGSVDDYTRGTSENCKHNKLKEGREESVIDHIQQFTTVEAHYVRADSDYCYLPANLNISKMYSMYEQWCRSSNPPKKAESYDFYRRTFNTKFKLKFHTPKKDQCDACESFKNTPD